jgi:hypothetical protein
MISKARDSRANGCTRNQLELKVSIPERRFGPGAWVLRSFLIEDGGRSARNATE